MSRALTALTAALICLGTAQVASGQGVDPSAVRGAIAPAISTNQALAREVTVGQQRLKRICDRTVTPPGVPPDPASLGAIEIEVRNFQKENEASYAAALKRVADLRKEHEADTEARGICEKNPKQKDQPTFSEGECNNSKIVLNNFKLLETDVKILIELLKRQSTAVDKIVLLEAKRCLRPGFAQKLAGAVTRDGPTNHKTLSALLGSLLGAARVSQ